MSAESAGAYPDAQNDYRAALAALGKKSGDIDDSIGRVSRLKQARADDAEIACFKGRR